MIWRDCSWDRESRSRRPAERWDWSGRWPGVRVIRTQLYGVEPTDPVTLGAIVVLLALVVLVASWAPARRAAGVRRRWRPFARDEENTHESSRQIHSRTPPATVGRPCRAHSGVRRER
jgi:hypothetical protein